MAVSQKKSPFTAKAASANDLRHGAVVFMTASGWSLDFDDALVAEDEAAALTMEERFKADLAANIVVDPYLFEVRLEDGRWLPAHFRERFRMLGPSVRPDLGKQAQRRSTPSFIPQA